MINFAIHVEEPAPDLIGGGGGPCFETPVFAKASARSLGSSPRMGSQHEADRVSLPGWSAREIRERPILWPGGPGFRSLIRATVAEGARRRVTLARMQRSLIKATGTEPFAARAAGKHGNPYRW
jgi:hypothetical protein